MNWIVASVGGLLIGLGFIIWRFKLIHLISNIEAARVISIEKATRLVFAYLCLLGSCFIALGYYINSLPQQRVLLIIGCFIPINMVVVVCYLVAQSRNMK